MLVAEDALSDEEIAAKVGVSRRTLTNWKQHPEFRARRDQKIAEFDAVVSRFPIAKRRERMRVLNDLHDKELALQAARAAAYAGKVPGGETGLMIPQIKIVSDGEGGTMPLTEWVRDDNSPEIRALHKQAAQETGQWSEKSTVNHTGGIRREIVVITEADMGPIDVTDEASFASIEADLDQLRGDDPYPEDAL